MCAGIRLRTGQTPEPRCESRSQVRKAWKSEGANGPSEGRAGLSGAQLPPSRTSRPAKRVSNLETVSSSRLFPQQSQHSS